MVDKNMSKQRDGMANIFNRQALLQRVEGDDELLGELLSVFFEQAPKQLQKMRQALEAGDAWGLQGEAHSLKGAAASISAEILVEAAWQVELAGKNQELDRARLLVEDLAQEYGRLQEVAGEHR